MALHLRDRHVLKEKTFFKKPEYRFLVEATKIENIPFPFKTAVRSQC